MFAKNGFQSLAEKSDFGRSLLTRFTSNNVENLSAPERLRISFEQLGPTFVKLGQLLATRPDLVPKEFSDEFRKLQDQVPAVPFAEMKVVLEDHFEQKLDAVFSSVDPNTIGAASIAQAYRATLISGEEVVIKVQRPNIDKVIAEDLDVLYQLAEWLHRYLPESRVYNPVGIVDVFAKTLEQEINFIVEANNIRRFAANFATDPDVRVPKVYNQYTGRRVLVMEALPGVALSQKSALEQEGIDPEVVLRRGLRAYLKMVFSDGLFHGDLHAGNVFILPDNKIGLIDFGVVGRLNRKTQTAIAGMLVALAEEDYDRLAYLYVDLAPFNEKIDADQFARDLRDLIAPYFGLTLKNVNGGRMLLDSAGLAARHGLVLPAELVLFFKSIVTIEGMARTLMSDFDFLNYSLEFAAELVKSRTEPARLMKEVSEATRDVNSLLGMLPRQLKQLLRRWNNPEASLKIAIDDFDKLNRTFQRGFDKTFRGIVILGLMIFASGVFEHNANAAFIAMGLALGLFLYTWFRK